MSEFFARKGPLGMDNMRNNKGRGAIIGDPSVPHAKRRETVLQAGAHGGPYDQNAGDALASFLTVTLGYDDANEQNAQTPVTLQADVLWGTDGYQQHATVDWRRGQVVRVAGSFVRVNARQVADANTGVFPAGAAASVGATVGYGCCGVTPATLTESRLIVNATTEEFRAPHHAYAFVLQTFAPSTFFVEWHAATGGTTEVSSLTGTSVDKVNPVPRPNAGHFLRLFNGDANPARTSVVWLLDI